MAVTHYYFNNINTNKYILYSVTSSPVEEMYHRQLVTTIDSILDARFDVGCCTEDSIEEELCFD